MTSSETMDNRDREPFEREDNGLVNLDTYIPYLVDPVALTPTRVSGRGGSINRFVKQHVYFTETVYHQSHLDLEERDRRLVALRNSHHSQMIMRSHQETQLHLDKETLVKPPPPATVDGALKDYFDIDLVGASVLSIQETMNPTPPDEWAQKYYTPPEEIKSLSKRDRIGIFLSYRDRAVESLEKPRALPEKVVTSALRRTAVNLGSLTLQRLVEERSIEGEVYYPLLAAKRAYLRDIGSLILSEAVGIREIETGRQFIQGLQTGVNRVQLAA